MGLALQTLSLDKNWDSHSLVNGYPSFYPRIALVAPSPGHCESTFHWRTIEQKHTASVDRRHLCSVGIDSRKIIYSKSGNSDNSAVTQSGCEIIL